MVGDGVNDVPALKAARLAIAQGTGTQMAQSVADLVLVRGDFGAVPAMVARGAEDPAQPPARGEALRDEVGVRVGADPLDRADADRVPAAAAAPDARGDADDRRARRSSSRSRRATARTASRGSSARSRRSRVPGGDGGRRSACISSYLFALNVLDLPLVEARTVATTVLIVVGLYLIVALEAAGRRRSTAVAVLCAALGSLYLAMLAIPFTREFFALAAPDPVIIATALTGASLAVAGLAVTSEAFLPGRR